MKQDCCSPKHPPVDECKTSCCSCCEPGFRKFITNAEKLEKLEKYKEQLEKELAGVEEHISALSAK